MDINAARAASKTDQLKPEQTYAEKKRDAETPVDQNEDNADAEYTKWFNANKDRPDVKSRSEQGKRQLFETETKGASTLNEQIKDAAKKPTGNRWVDSQQSHSTINTTGPSATGMNRGDMNQTYDDFIANGGTDAEWKALQNQHVKSAAATAGAIVGNAALSGPALLTRGALVGNAANELSKSVTGEGIEPLPETVGPKTAEAQTKISNVPVTEEQREESAPITPEVKEEAKVEAEQIAASDPLPTATPEEQSEYKKALEEAKLAALQKDPASIAKSFKRILGLTGDAKTDATKKLAFHLANFTAGLTGKETAADRVNADFQAERQQDIANQQKLLEAGIQSESSKEEFKRQEQSKEADVGREIAKAAGISEIDDASAVMLENLKADIAKDAAATANQYNREFAELGVHLTEEMLKDVEDTKIYALQKFKDLSPEDRKAMREMVLAGQGQTALQQYLKMGTDVAGSTLPWFMMLMGKR